MKNLKKKKQYKNIKNGESILAYNLKNNHCATSFGRRR